MSIYIDRVRLKQFDIDRYKLKQVDINRFKLVQFDIDRSGKNKYKWICIDKSGLVQFVHGQVERQRDKQIDR